MEDRIRFVTKKVCVSTHKFLIIALLINHNLAEISKRILNTDREPENTLTCFLCVLKDRPMPICNLSESGLENRMKYLKFVNK